MRRITLSLREADVDRLDDRQDGENITSRSAALRDILDEYEDLHTRVEDLRRSYEDSQQTCEALRERLADRDERIADLEARLDEREDDLADRVEALEARLDALDAASNAPTNENGHDPPQDPPVDTDGGSTGADSAPERTASVPPTDAAGSDTVDRVVQDVADGWSDTDERLRARKAAARAVLAHAVETGDAIGKSDVEPFHEEYPVEGQTFETWWRKNVRPVLKAVGTYSQGHHGYVVDPLAADS